MNYFKFLAISVTVLGLIFVGQTSVQANESDNRIHNIVRGDTLFAIAKQYGVTIADIKNANSLSGNLIMAGGKLVIPAQGASVTTLASATSANNTTLDFNNDDIYWLARMIHAEARGESHEGQVAVGSVILNRVKHANFPNTVYDVIFEVTNGKHYQFSPAADGSIWLEPNAAAYEAANAAINGWDPSGGALYFYNPVKSTSKWIFSRPVIKQIGQHVFAL
ncbi:MAG: cell wall hydrolase [Bacillota bacterium]|nr:cell wall hydrolase [Bacillota bacterium]